jgi:hypothetical protein
MLAEDGQNMKPCVSIIIKIALALERVDVISTNICTIGI